MSWYGNTSWGVSDYPEPPAVTLEDGWRKHHRDLDEDDEEAEDDE